MGTNKKIGAAPREKRRRSAKKVTWWELLLLILLGLFLASAVLGTLYVKNKLNKIHYAQPTQEPVGAEETPAPADAPDPFAGEDELPEMEGLEHVEENTVPEGETFSDRNVLNILLMGTDYPYNSSDRGRADSIMILSLDFRDYSASLVSLERGMGVPILSGKYAGQWDWLTHLHHYGGPEMMLETIRWCFKLDLERYAEVDFTGFRNVIDALGGIDVELSDAEAWKLGLRTGWNHLDGEAALSFARLRSIDSDWIRVTRQRRVIQACVNGVRDADLRTLDRLADAVLPLITTNLTQSEILSLMTKLPAFRGVQLRQMTIPAPGTYGGMTVMGGRGSFAPDFEENTRILREFIYGQ